MALHTMNEFHTFIKASTLRSPRFTETVQANASTEWLSLETLPYEMDGAT